MKTPTKELKRLANEALEQVRRPVASEPRDARVGPPNIDGMCHVDMPILFGHASDQQMTLKLDGPRMLGHSVTTVMPGGRALTQRREGRFELEISGGILTIKLIPDQPK